MGPTVSVAMATYNGERFLQEQLASLASQTLLPCELVVCDDGSTDGTLDVLRRFAESSPFPVRVHQNEERLGHGLNFLRTASLCSGSLIAFCDQDDVWFENKLQRCAAGIAETGSVLAIHSAKVVDERLRPLRGYTPSARRLMCLDAGMGRTWHSLHSRMEMSPGFTWVFKARLLRDVPPTPPVVGPSIGHEGWLSFAAEVIGRIALLPDVLALYRQHGKNVIGYRASPGGSLSETFAVAASEYLLQAEDSAARARLLRDASERLPELRSRLVRAQWWYDARSESLRRRALLYTEKSSGPEAAKRFFSLLIAGTYRATSRGGLGFKSLAKDFVVPFLPCTVKR